MSWTRLGSVSVSRYASAKYGSKESLISSGSLTKSSTIVLGLQLARRARVGAVEPRQRLHRGHAGEPLVHVHRAEQRLVEAGLELVGDQHDPEVVAAERGAKALPAEARVHRAFGERLRPRFRVIDRAGERDQRAESFVALLFDVLVDRDLVTAPPPCGSRSRPSPWRGPPSRCRRRCRGSARR